MSLRLLPLVLLLGCRAPASAPPGPPPVVSGLASSPARTGAVAAGDGEQAGEPLDCARADLERFESSHEQWEALGPGDVVRSGEVPLRLPPGVPCDVALDHDDETGRIHFTDAAGRRTLVGLDLRYRDLDTLEPDDFRDLWGILLEADDWNPRLLAALAAVPPRACVALGVNHHAPVSDWTHVGRIDRECLFLDDLEDGALLRDLRSLQIFSLGFGAELDLDWLDAPRLRALVADTVTPAASLARFPELRHLTVVVSDLSFAPSLGHLEWLNVNGSGVTDLSPIASLGRLVRLNVRRTGVTDLSPLAALPVEHVNASFAPVTRLPAGRMPRLVTLDVMSTRLTDEAVAAFRAANPQTRVRHRWAGALADAARPADRIRVSIVAGCCGASGPRTFEIADRAEIDGLLSLVAAAIVDEPERAVSLGCGPDVRIELRQGTRELARLGYYCAAIADADVWPGIVPLAGDGAARLKAWMEARGVVCKERPAAAE